MVGKRKGPELRNFSVSQNTPENLFPATDPSGQPTQPSEIVLHGAHQSGSRFGFSLAAAGDLNKDGFNDIIVGAPSTSTGDGEWRTMSD